MHEFYPDVKIIFVILKPKVGELVRCQFINRHLFKNKVL